MVDGRLLCKYVIYFLGKGSSSVHTERTLTVGFRCCSGVSLRLSPALGGDASCPERRVSLRLRVLRYKEGFII